MALFCCRYLSSRPFTGGDQNVTANIHSGYFGFLDYAAAHYAVHLQHADALEVSTNSETQLESVKTAAVDLAKANCKEFSVKIGDINEEAENLDLTIQDRVLVVRTLIGLQRKKSETAGFDAIEGPLRHKCHRVRCSKFAVGFSNEAALKKHLAAHERPFRCPHSDCFGHTVGYATPRRLESHNEAFHHNTTKSKELFPTEPETREWGLYEACNAGNLDEVKRFHREGADLHDTVRTFVTPLCVAVEAGHGHICKYLVDNGVSPFRYRYKGKIRHNQSRLEQMPVGRAIHLERLAILEFFLQHGDGPDDSVLAENIARAIHAKRPAALNMLLTTRQGNHADVIKLVPVEIISRTGFRASQRDGHPTNNALIHTWFQCIKPELYNEKGAFIAQSDCAEYKVWGNIFFKQLGLFGDALEWPCFPLATFLMDIGNHEYLQIDKYGLTPLHRFLKGLCKRACSGCMSMLRRLLQYEGVKFANLVGSDGSLPAHAALRGRVSQDILRPILDNTGDINCRDNSGRSLLHLAISAASIRVLLENKSVDLFIRNNQGQTAFSALLEDGYDLDIEALECLFEADPRLASTADDSKAGLTPLHHALENLQRSELLSPRVAMKGAAKFLLTCSEVKKVLRAFQANSTDTNRKFVRDFARKERLQEALDIMDSISL
jgi:ankyrin repeat protein